jgi:hypothetical protein
LDLFQSSVASSGWNNQNCAQQSSCGVPGLMRRVKWYFALPPASFVRQLSSFWGSGATESFWTPGPFSVLISDL